MTISKNAIKFPRQSSNMKSNGLWKVILCQKIRGLGKRNEVVFVRYGYFRNFLSKGLAVVYNEKTLENMLSTSNEAIVNSIEEKAREIYENLNNKVLFFARQASGTDVLYGSVSKFDIAQEIHKNFNVEIDPKKIIINNIIKKIGVYDIIIDLSETVIINIKISVNSSIEDAKKAIEKITGEGDE
jgi:large subunit ribosomal protein L9